MSGRERLTALVRSAARCRQQRSMRVIGCRPTLSLFG